MFLAIKLSDVLEDHRTSPDQSVILKKKKDVRKIPRCYFNKAEPCWQQTPGPVKTLPNVGQVQRQRPRLLNAFLVMAISAFASTCFCRNRSDQTLSTRSSFLLVFSGFLPQSGWDFFFKVTFQSTDTLLLGRLSKARRPWHKGLHLDAVQSVRLQPAEHERVVGNTLGPLG